MCRAPSESRCLSHLSERPRGPRIWTTADAASRGQKLLTLSRDVVLCSSPERVGVARFTSRPCSPSRQVRRSGLAKRGPTGRRPTRSSRRGRRTNQRQIAAVSPRVLLAATLEHSSRSEPCAWPLRPAIVPKPRCPSPPYTESSPPWRSRYRRFGRLKRVADERNLGAGPDWRDLGADHRRTAAGPKPISAKPALKW